MGTVAGATNGLAYLTQPGGLLSNLPASVSASALQSASPEDVVTLSAAALQAQEVDGIFGISPATQSAIELPTLESATAGSTVLPGVSSADLSNATPQQQYALNSQAVALQEAQQLFAPSAATGSAV